MKRATFETRYVLLYIHIYTIQQLRYPLYFITNTHIHILYYTATTIPLIFHHKHNIFTFILYSNYDTPYISSQHTYLHLYYTATTIPLIFHHKHTYLHLYYTATTIPQRSITILNLYPRSLLDDTTFNSYLDIQRSFTKWSTDLSGRYLTFITNF